MANIILLKRKTTAGAPSLASLAVGEACVVIPDNTLYIKKDAGTLLSWPAGAGAGDLLAANNLSDLLNPATARTNLDVKSSAEITSQISLAITAAIDALIGGAPGALDTLNELAAAMADDAAFSATVTAALATKLDGSSTIDGGTI